MGIKSMFFRMSGYGMSGYRVSRADGSRELLVATRNIGKIKEFKELLNTVPYEIKSLDQIGIATDVEETGQSFEENASLKAREYANMSGLLTFCDDSGLEVDALEGAPGVQSARYGGPGLSDEDRVKLLLENMKDVEWERRTARFRCVIAIANPAGEIQTVTDTVEGLINYEPKGTNGFGYDPVFHLPELGLTTAELPMAQKNALSHRGRAARKAVELLKAL